jgi:hypothetical protein
LPVDHLVDGGLMSQCTMMLINKRKTDGETMTENIQALALLHALCMAIRLA